MQSVLKPNPLVCPITKFINLLLQLYTPIPAQIRNQLRSLQSTLMHGQMSQLNELVEHMQEKLKLKSRQNQIKNLQSVSSIRYEPSPCRVQTFRHDADKENKYFLSNLSGTGKNMKKKESSISFVGRKDDSNRSRNTSSIEETEPTLDSQRSSREDRSCHGINRSSSRTLLKIVKKAKQVQPTDMAVPEQCMQPMKASTCELLKKQTDDILSCMQRLDLQLGVFVEQGWKISLQSQ